MKLSATQDETYLRCKRQWWFQYPIRMPTLPKSGTDFGTVIHGVTERFRKADDIGRDPQTGTPVDLFPPGWDEAEGRKIPSAHAELIRRLIDAAIESGVLERRPGRQTERWFDRDLIPDVTIVGKIDCQVPGEIEDDKSTSDLKYAKTEKRGTDKYLGSAPQMLTYAKILLDDEPRLNEVALRHNYYLKRVDKPTVRKVRVTVSRDEVEANWRRLQEQAADMQAWAECTDVSKWEQIEGPSSPGACTAFGGCPFQEVCGKAETPQDYRTRVERLLQYHTPVQEITSFEDAWSTLPRATSENHMSNVFDNLVKSRAAAPTVPAGAVQINGAIVSAAPVQPTAATAVAESPKTFLAPPWAVADCPACKGTGFNRAGSPCRICDSKQKAAGKATSADFVVEPDGQGGVVWEARDGSGGGSATLSAPPPATKVQIKLQVERPTEPGPAAAGEPPPPAPGAVQMPANPTPLQQAAATEVLGLTPPQPAVNLVDRLRQPLAEAPTLSPIEQMRAANAAAAAAATQAKVDAEAAKSLDLPAKGKPGRRKAGWMLYIDCVPMGVETVLADSMFVVFATELAQQAGKTSYYDMDPFKRRESFARAFTADNLEDRLNQKHIVVRNPTGCPDLRAFVDALAAVALPGRVIQGIR